jgi:hypothetical protein
MSGSFSQPITPRHPGYVSGRYYQFPDWSNLLSSTATTTGYVYYTYVYVPISFTIQSINFYVFTAQSGSTARVGLYNVANGLPTSLIQDFGTVNTSSTGPTSIATTSPNLVLTPGWYAIAYSSSVSNVFVGQTLYTSDFSYSLLGTHSVADTPPQGYRSTSSYGAYPSTAPLQQYGSMSVPVFWLQAA